MKKIYFQWLQAILLLSSFGASAQSLDPNHVYKLVCRATGQALEIGGGGNFNDEGRVANTWGYWGGAHQQWIFSPYPNNGNPVNNYIIINRTSRQALTGDNPNAGSSFHQYKISTTYTSPNYVPSNTQLWTIQQAGSYPGAPYLLQLPGGYYMAADGNNNVFKQSYDPNNSTMLWDIVDVSQNASLNYTQGSFQIINPQVYAGGPYAIGVSHDDPSKRDVRPFNSPYSGSGIANAYEEWTLVPSTTTSGYYYIVTRLNGLVLGIINGATNNGATLSIEENHQYPWQEWAFLDKDDSHILQPSEFTDGRICKLYSRHAGKLIELNPSLSNDFPYIVDMINDYGTNTQRWKLKFDSYNRLSGSPLATNQASNSDKSLSIYPNPAQETLTLTPGSQFDLAISTVNVVDACGKQVEVHYHNGQVDISRLTTGLYVITVSDGEQTVRHKFSKL